MAEQSSQEKTELPTRKRYEDARKKGQVAQSKELTMFFSLICILAYFLFFFNTLYGNFLEIYDNIFHTITFFSFAHSRENELSLATIVGSAMGVLRLAVLVILIPTLIAAFVSAAMNVAQLGGFALATEVFELDIKKFNPVTNAKNIFSMKNLIKFGKDMLQLTLMFYISYYIVSNDIQDLIKSAYYDVFTIAFVFFKVIAEVVIALMIIYIIFSIADFFIQKKQLEKQLMMTKEELKNEFKETEGNPETKGRRREMHRELLEEDAMSSSIRQSSLVITNPTHIAIVILYNPKKVKLPAVVLKVRGKTAPLVTKLAKKFNIPIVRDVWLARRLYDYAEVGKYIPSSLILPVADIIGKNAHLIPHMQPGGAHPAPAKPEAINLFPASKEGKPGVGPIS